MNGYDIAAVKRTDHSLDIRMNGKRPFTLSVHNRNGNLRETLEMGLSISDCCLRDGTYDKEQHECVQWVLKQMVEAVDERENPMVGIDGSVADRPKTVFLRGHRYDMDSVFMVMDREIMEMACDIHHPGNLQEVVDCYGEEYRKLTGTVFDMP